MTSHAGARQAILQAAEELFVRYGFRKTSMDDVCRAARIGKGTVYLHFSSKEHLFAEIVRRVSARMLDTLTTAVQRARTPFAKLRAFIEAKLMAVAVIASEYQLRDETMMELLPRAAAHRQLHFAQECSLLMQLLRDGIASGAFALEHPDRLATGLMAWLDTFDADVARRREEPEVWAGLEELVVLILRGLSPAQVNRSA